MRLSTDHKEYNIVMLYLINGNKHSNRPSNCLQLLKCQKKICFKYLFFRYIELAIK